MDNHDNFLVNFSLKGFTSIRVGIYFLVASYLIKTILDGFLLDDNLMGMMSAEIIEVLIITITFFLFLFSSLALFFSGKRNAKKFNYKLWNQKTKTAFWKYILTIVLIFIVLIVLTNLGYIDFITPIFLLLYSLLLFIFKNKERKHILVLAGLCLFLAGICFLIPMYWYSSLVILGIAHITYGVVVRN